MIIVHDGNNTYRYDTASEVYEDYPNITVHGNEITIEEQPSG